MKEKMEARLGWLESLMEDGEAPMSDKVDGLLTVLGEVRNELSLLASPYNEAEEHIKAEIRSILEEFYPDDRYDSDVGTAQILRPKDRISYDTKGLEALRLSSYKMQRLFGHLRSVKPSKPYLKVKFK